MSKDFSWELKDFLDAEKTERFLGELNNFWGVKEFSMEQMNFLGHRRIFVEH